GRRGAADRRRNAAGLYVADVHHRWLVPRGAGRAGLRDGPGGLRDDAAGRTGRRPAHAGAARPTAHSRELAVAMIEADRSEQPQLVRPYTRTGGRTRTNMHLPLEALIVTTPQGQRSEAFAQPETREITVLCHDVRSVAEVAAIIGVPLGVARVLIAD